MWGRPSVEEQLAPFMGKAVTVTIRITGRLERVYGDEILVAGHRGMTRYVKKSDIDEIEEVTRDLRPR
jgi:hypothetical protein